MEFIEDIPTPNLDNVVMHGSFGKKIEGTLCLTGHYILLSSRTEHNDELMMLTINVDAVERKLNGPTGGSVILKCKDFRIIQLDISPLEAFNNVATSIETLSSFEDQTKFYPFFFRPNYPILEDGWTAFQPELEFSKLLQGDDWRITYVNSDFKVCPTYPKALVVPKKIDDKTIMASAKFRDGGRFPVLSYRHEKGTVLLRSSQPLTGASSHRCKEDKDLLDAVLGPGTRGYVIDTRSPAAAQAAKSRGGGFELEMHYPQWRRVSKPIERYTGLLDSLTRLIEACNDTSLSMDRWLSRLESSNWISHVKDTLNCACIVAQCLEEEARSVLVHGSEGLDATLLVTSLTQIILNPDCRTVRGLQALVEREWLQAGHPFPRRHSHSVYSPSRSKQNAPTFLLLLDCIVQIQTQFPCSFEFSSSLLMLLFEHSYSSQFGKIN
ncbi:LOW QUALITY PROTEIN: myotubularin-related protein 9 [Homalodisca vitripennis]|uniref:LOW QUALITY PROTEIN: myotubularin-related protein 9 n=1 Tax=Homalodisca vitripennis TaxID=197043 RepID=UPI001EEA44C2|nr:LOW QUALITY PROTEIN: myotubularin-related protein 9 [Homalodisca vitripennis]